MLFSIDRLGDILDIRSGGDPQSRPVRRDVPARAAALQAAGVRRRDAVVLCQTASPQFFMDLLAVWTAGATAVCLDPALTQQERSNVVTFTKAQALLLAEEDPGRDWPLKPLRFDDREAGQPKFSGSELDDPALILFTSGTTGDPKGVVHTFRSVLSRIAINIGTIELSANDIGLLTLPVHFGHGLIGNALSPLFAEARLFIPPTGMALATKLGVIIDDHRITFLSSVPALWRMAMKLSPKPKRGSLRRVHVGSAPIAKDLILQIEDWAGCAVHNCYGITETANWIGSASSHHPLMRDGFVGKPWAGAAGILGEDGRIRSSGEGEIVVQTPSLMTGYLNRPDLTAQALLDGWYRTGDWGSVDDAGNICLSGRLKDEINRAGFKVQPAEVDMLLETHPDIDEACAFGIPDPVSSEIVAAAVKLRVGAKLTAAALRNWCLERLRQNAVPERWFFVNEIPKTARGKLRRDVVRRTVLGEKE